MKLSLPRPTKALEKESERLETVMPQIASFSSVTCSTKLSESIKKTFRTAGSLVELKIIRDKNTNMTNINFKILALDKKVTNKKIKESPIKLNNPIQNPLFIEKSDIAMRKIVVKSRKMEEKII